MQTMQMSSSAGWFSGGPTATGLSLKMAFPGGMSRRATRCLKWRKSVSTSSFSLVWIKGKYAEKCGPLFTCGEADRS